MVNDLPVRDVAGEVVRVLGESGHGVLVAPTGSGKSTLLPALLLDAPWCSGSILVLEPRRLAARAVAHRLAAQRGSAVGDEVGYSIRHERRRSAATRIEVVTEGILVRRLTADPSLEGVSLVIVDEFHERSLDSDLALALLGEVRASLRPDLRVLVMSATPDLDSARRALGADAPVVRAEGRSFPVEVAYRALDLRKPWVDEVAHAVLTTVLGDGAGASTGSTGGGFTPAAPDVLVFLPGAPEVHQVHRRLGGLPAGWVVRPLTGSSTVEEQDAALSPDPSGRRRLVLATAVAQTSLTIEGIGLVIDGGRARSRHVDPESGIGRLVTTRVSRATAEQRRGRAGRLTAGRCLRLWAETEHRHLDDHDRPAILTEDLTALALTLAMWGAPDGVGPCWPDAPDPARLAAARSTLTRLGFLDATGRVTQHGRAADRLGIDPRAAAVALAGATAGDARSGARLAALVEEPGEIDLMEQLTEWPGRGVASDRRRRLAADLERRLARLAPVSPPAGGATGNSGAHDPASFLLAGFPDRVARRRERGGHLLPNGRVVHASGHLAEEPWLIVVDLDADPTAPRVFAAAAMTEQQITAWADAHGETAEVVRWDRRRRRLEAASVLRIGAVTIRERRIDRLDPDAVETAWREALASEGVLPGTPGPLRWTDAATALVWRVRACRRYAADRAPSDSPWPDWSDEHLIRELPGLVAASMTRARTLDDAAAVDIHALLQRGLPWPLPRLLDELAPTRLGLPEGRSAAVDWSQDPPVVRARIQHCFGLSDTPRVLGGRVPVVMHLLSPAGRPAAVTSDLAGFWTGGYLAVRADLRGRYPRHPWPLPPFPAPSPDLGARDGRR